MLDSVVLKKRYSDQDGDLYSDEPYIYESRQGDSESRNAFHEEEKAKKKLYEEFEDKDDTAGGGNLLGSDANDDYESQVRFPAAFARFLSFCRVCVCGCASRREHEASNEGKEGTRGHQPSMIPPSLVRARWERHAWDVTLSAFGQVRSWEDEVNADFDAIDEDAPAARKQTHGLPTKDAGSGDGEWDAVATVPFAGGGLPKGGMGGTSEGAYKENADGAFEFGGRGVVAGDRGMGIGRDFEGGSLVKSDGGGQGIAEKQARLRDGDYKISRESDEKGGGGAVDRKWMLPLEEGDDSQRMPSYVGKTPKTRQPGVLTKLAIKMGFEPTRKPPPKMHRLTKKEIEEQKEWENMAYGVV